MNFNINFSRMYLGFLVGYLKHSESYGSTCFIFFSSEVDGQLLVPSSGRLWIESRMDAYRREASSVSTLVSALPTSYLPLQGYEPLFLCFYPIAF
jgi:hypothetical protein